MTDELLPALPEPALRIYYTDDQMRAYAREAIRLAQGLDYVEIDNAKAADSAALAMIGMGYAWDGNCWYLAKQKPSPPAGEVA